MEPRDGAGVEAEEATEPADATGTAINTNNQDNKRAAEGSGGGAQQPSAGKKPRRNKRDRASHRTRGVKQRAHKRSACEALSESDEREAGGERQKGNLKKSE